MTAYPLLVRLDRHVCWHAMETRMTCPSLTLESAAYALRDGSALFSDLNIRIDQRATGLVGPMAWSARTAAASPHCCSCWRAPPAQRRALSGACAGRLSGSPPGAAGPSALGRCAVAGRGSGCAGPRTAAAPVAAGAGRARADLPCSQLSGGQRLKPALDCALYRAQPAQLLLLDEPTHHLDLASVEAIGALLRGHQGALVVASHDDAAFLQRLGLQQRLDTAQAQWRLAPW